MDTRVDDLDRKALGQCGQRPDILTVDAGRQACDAAVAQAYAVADMVAGLDSAEYPQLRGCVGDQLLRVARPEGATATQQLNGFQDRGFTRPVVTCDQVQARMQRQLHPGEAAQVLEP